MEVMKNEKREEVKSVTVTIEVEEDGYLPIHTELGTLGDIRFVTTIGVCGTEILASRGKRFVSVSIMPLLDALVEVLNPKNEGEQQDAETKK